MHAPVFSSVSMTFKITLFVFRLSQSTPNKLSQLFPVIIRSLGAYAFASIRSTQLYFCHNNCRKGNGSEKRLHSSTVQMRLPLSRKRQKKPCLSLLQRRKCHSMHQIFPLVNSPDNHFIFFNISLSSCKSLQIISHTSIKFTPS